MVLKFTSNSASRKENLNINVPKTPKPHCLEFQFGVNVEVINGGRRALGQVVFRVYHLHFGTLICSKLSLL